MHLKFVCKDPQSYTGQCPSIYEAVGPDGRDGLVIQGKTLAVNDAAQMQEVAPDESGVWIPKDLLLRYLGQA